MGGVTPLPVCMESFTYILHNQQVGGDLQIITIHVITNSILISKSTTIKNIPKRKGGVWNCPKINYVIYVNSPLTHRMGGIRGHGCKFEFYEQ